MMMMLTMTMLFLTMFLIFGWLSNAVPDWSARVETLGANIFEERKLTHSGDYLQTPLGEEQLVLLFMATLVILVTGTTSTGIELQDPFAED